MQHTGSKIYSKVLQKELSNRVFREVLDEKDFNTQMRLHIRNLNGKRTMMVHHYTDMLDYLQVEYELQSDDGIEFGRVRLQDTDKNKGKVLTQMLYVKEPKCLK